MNVISVRTEEILDYALKTLYCHECIAHNKDDKDIKVYQKWKDMHSSQCSINHTGSAERMEKDGATEIFLRSIETRGLVYNIFVSDGDTSTFGTVKEACFEKFGELYGIQKEECVGHIQKRMDKGLRQYKLKNKSIKLSDGKGVGCSGRLTDLIIDKMQNNFGEPIRNNIGNRDNMDNAIWAIFKHRLRNDVESLEKQHDLCPRNGWCTFWSCFDKKRLPHVFVA